MSGRDPNDYIGELKEELRRHKRKIADLEQQLQQDRNCSTEKIRKLEDEKNTLEKEVSGLKKRIKWLEDEVKYFSTKPVITDLNKRVQEKDARMNSLEERMNRMEKRHQDELKSCHEEIHYFCKKSQSHEKNLETYMAKTDELEKSRNRLYIGQLCSIVMEAIYWRVVPVYFEKDKKGKNDYKQPHLREIDKKIEELYQTRRDKVDAQRRWKKLQDEKIDSDESKVKELVDFMEEMLAERHVVAHPSLFNEKELKEIANNLPGQKQQLFAKVIEISKEMIPTIFVAF